MRDPLFTNKTKLVAYIRKNINNCVVKDHMDVCTEEYCILLTNQWFNDKIINFYFNLIKIYATIFEIKVYVFSTYFYTSLKTKGIKWVQKYTKDENIFLNDYIFIPVHRNNHWVFVNVDVNNDEIEYYDSLFSEYRIVSDIIDYLESERAAKNLKPVKYTMVERNYPKQHNGYDCGLFICMYARNRIFGTHMSFKNKNMYEYRLRLAHELLEGEIIYSLGHQFTK
ncbi:Protease, Ulp1 family [Trachipleistophora hominis]|uniref:Protease, Ulp1 family n=1 Tax=Trachipleistophora hominis TaxID=72359 RepID=L7JRP0_TRAHO|nr:Protease, Ulp1 family [Trachipleistophora hominis]